MSGSRCGDELGLSTTRVLLGILALGFSTEVLVAISALTGRMEIGVATGILVLLTLLGLWYAWPLAVRAWLHRRAG